MAPYTDIAPASVFFYSRDRGSEYPQWHLTGYCGILQAGAYAGLNALYKPERLPSAHIQDRLLGLNVGRSDDFSPPLGFVGDKLAEFGW